MQQSHSYHPGDKMRASLCSILLISVMAQAYLAMPLQGVEGDNGVRQRVSAYHQKIIDLLLLSEDVLSEFRDSFPQLDNKFDDYLSRLRDYKNHSSKTAAETKELLESWTGMLAMVKAEIAENTEETTTTTNYDDEESSGDYDDTYSTTLPTTTAEVLTSEKETSTEKETVSNNEEPQGNKTLKIAFLNKQLQKLQDNEHLNETQKSIALITRMVEWDEKYDKQSFAEEVDSAFQDIILDDQNLPKQLIEYTRLRGLFLEMTTEEQNAETLDRLQVFEECLEAFTINPIEIVDEDTFTATTRTPSFESKTTTTDMPATTSGDFRGSSSEEQIPVVVTTTTTVKPTAIEQVTTIEAETTTTEMPTATYEDFGGSSSEEQIPIVFNTTTTAKPISIKQLTTIEPETTTTEMPAVTFDNLRGSFPEVQIPIVITTTTTVKPTSIKQFTTIEELLRDEKKKLKLSPQIMYLEQKLNELKNNILLTDSQKAYVVLASMVAWDELNDSESFNMEVHRISEVLISEDPAKVKLMAEFKRLTNLHMEMIKWDSSYDSQFRIQSLIRYLNAFTFDTEQIATNNFNNMSVIQAGDSLIPQHAQKMLEDSIFSQHFQPLPGGGGFVSHRFETHPIEVSISTQSMQTNPFGSVDFFGI